jgi:hypothetical protein
MSKRRKTLLLLAGGVVLVVGAGWLFMPEREPIYKGRKLRQWVEQGGESDLRYKTPNPEAAEAIRQIGARAVPHLLNWMAYERRPWMTKLAAFLGSQKMLKRLDDSLVAKESASLARASGATVAFKYLGPEGKTALPRLARLLNNAGAREGKIRAAKALGCLGSDAVPTLVVGLSNQDPAARMGCLSSLQRIGSRPGPAGPAVVRCLGDTNYGVRYAARSAIYALKLPPALVVPALSNCLQHADAQVRGEAAGFLMSFWDSAARQANPRRQAIFDKLRRIKLDTVFFDKVPLDEVVRGLAEAARKRDPNPKVPLNFLISTAAGQRGPEQDRDTGAFHPLPDIATNIIRVTPRLRNVTLEEALEMVVRGAAQPIEYAVEDYGIIFAAKPPPALRFGLFRLETNTVGNRLVGSEIRGSANQQASSFCASLGLKLEPAHRVFWNPRVGLLRVKATEEDLYRIENVIREQDQTVSNPGRAAPAPIRVTLSPAPTVTNQLEVEPTSPRLMILDRLRILKLDQLYFDNVPLSEVIRSLSDETIKRDPATKNPINFLIGSVADPPSAGPLVDPATSFQIPGTEEPGLAAVKIRVTLPVKNITLEEALDIIVKCAAQPIKYSVEDYGIIFTRHRDTERFYFRTFKMDTNLVIQLRADAGPNVVAPFLTNWPPGARSGDGYLGPFMTPPNREDLFHHRMGALFASLGLNLEAPRAAYWNDRHGLLLVKATLEELDTIEAIVQALNQASGQIPANAPALPR